MLHPSLCREPWLDALMGAGTGQEKTKAAIRERLRNMNMQFSAIDEMSHQIEQDFRSARSVSGPLYVYIYIYIYIYIYWCT